MGVGVQLLAWEMPIMIGGVALAGWFSIDRRKWWLIHTYRKHRADIDARNHIEWARALLK